MRAAGRLNRLISLQLGPAVNAKGIRRIRFDVGRLFHAIEDIIRRVMNHQCACLLRRFGQHARRNAVDEARRFRFHLRLRLVHSRIGGGIEDDLVVLFHQPTGEIRRATFEPMPNRPYSVIRYLRGEGFYGIGICEMAEVWQNTTSRILNFDIDKILLSNAPMLGVKEGANVVPDEPVFPGKQWHLTNPKEDLVPLFLTAPGSFDIATLRAYLGDQGKQRIGLTDLQFGTVGALPSRTPATAARRRAASSMLEEPARPSARAHGRSAAHRRRPAASPRTDPCG